MTVSTAESCTGGELSLLMTSVPGSSNYFTGGIVTYATQKKIDLLHVSEGTIERFTVVSEEVAREMAEGCQNLFQTDISISTTGVAGPGKGEDGKDIGLIYYTIKVKNQSETFKLFLPHLERKDFVYFVSQKIIQDLVGILIRK